MKKKIKWIKRKLDRCDNCWRKSEYKFSLPDLGPMNEKGIVEVKYHYFYYCYQHSETSGFCMGCGGFFAGTEEFFQSGVRGLCVDCKEELEYDLGLNEDPYEDEEWEWDDNDCPLIEPSKEEVS